MTTWQPILLSRVTRPNSEKITTYLDSGGYTALRKALAIGAEAVMAEVKKAGLVGRGGG